VGQTPHGPAASLYLRRGPAKALRRALTAPAASLDEIFSASDPALHGLYTRTPEVCFELEQSWRTILETLLYQPVKAFLEGLGFVVKGEVRGCDLVALRGDDPPLVVIGELKLTFNLELVLQGVDRAAACDEVWLAARLSSREKGRENDARFRKTFAEGSVSACSECGRMVRLTCW
jgi:hypothetical protein